MIEQIPLEPEKGSQPGSYTRRVTGAFVLVSVATVLVIVGVLGVFWGGHFAQYSESNMQRLAEQTAESVATAYEDNHGSWYGGTLSSAEMVSALYDTVTVRVERADGSVIYRDTNDPDGSTLGLRKNAKNTASADIMVGDEKVGTVYVSVYGSDTLLTAADQDFQSSTYLAILLAGLFALAVALVAGMSFSRMLVKPIDVIADAANRIKEGDYSARANLAGTDEVARLGETFDRMAESIEANRDMERRLVTDVAHELRTPLMAIQATVEAIIDGVYEASPERLETLNSEVRRLSRLVDALLKLSRLENRSNPVKMKRLDLSELLETVVESHEAFVVESGLNFVFERDPHVYVMGNADMIRQATANLISNAVRYTPEGGTVTLSVHKGELMGQIAVQDTGIGLTPEEAKMVFSRFWRADRGRSRDSGGLGIGLSVVKEIVDRHNGWVHVEGRPNEGSRFTIYIPLIREVDVSKRRLLRRENPKNFS